MQYLSDKNFYGGKLYIMVNSSKKTQLPTGKDIEAGTEALCQAPDPESGLSAVQETPQEEIVQKGIDRPNGDRSEIRPLSDAEKNDVFSFVELI